MIDQARYAKAMMTRFLPNYDQEPTPEEQEKYASPVKKSTIFTKEDCSKTQEEVQELEREYGFRYIELAGCFNWLSYTCFEEIFAIQKLSNLLIYPGKSIFR